MLPKEKFSRRDFLKFIAIGLGGTLVVFRLLTKRTSTPTIAPSVTPFATSSPTPTSALTPTNTPAHTATQTPTPTSILCFKLLTPIDGAKLNAIGKVTFSWEAMEGAASYKLEIILPTGQIIPFDVNGVSRDQYIEALKMGGAFQWRVLAMDANGATICESEPFSFEKPETPAEDPTQNSGGEDDGGDTTGGGPGSGSGGSGSNGDG